MKVILKNIFTSILFISVFSQINAQKAVLDKNSILIGDQIALKLQIDLQAGKEIHFPLFEKTLIDGIEIVSESLDTINNGKTLEKTLYITSFEDSVFTIPPISISVGTDTVKTNQLRLKVSKFKPDSAFLAAIDTNQMFKIRDIKPIMETPWTFKEFWQRFGKIILIILISVFLIAAIIYYIIRRIQNKPIFTPPKPKIPPHITALELLNTLKEEKLWQKDRIKEYYTQLTDILRIYIEERFSIPAPEYTSYQIIESLDSQPEIPQENKMSLGKMLSTADLVKFAKAQPLEFENEIALKTAFDFVEKTIPAVVEKPEIETIKEEIKTNNIHSTSEKIKV